MGVVGLAVLILSSTPIVAYSLINSLESQYPPLTTVPDSAQAIVVMGGGRDRNRPDFNGDPVNSYGLERLRFAAHLYRQSQLPVIIAAGRSTSDGNSEAEHMQTVLQHEFGVPVQWLETRSQNTYENVLHLAMLLQEQGIDHVLVVTHAWHMPRTLWAFNHVGINVTAAPTAFNRQNPISTGINAFVPQANAMMISRVVVHEWLGKLWYQYRYQ